MKNTRKKSKHKKKARYIVVICWIITPISVLILLFLDGLGLYPFNTERLMVLGAFAVISLIPFCNEITIKNFSIKKDSKDE